MVIHDRSEDPNAHTNTEEIQQKAVMERSKHATTLITTEKQQQTQLAEARGALPRRLPSGAQTTFGVSRGWPVPEAHSRKVASRCVGDSPH